MMDEDKNKLYLFYENIAVKEEESFDFENLSKYIVDALIRSQPPFVYAICGKWGSGKSSLLNFVLESLKINAENSIAIYFNAWRYSFHSDIFTAFVHELVDQLLMTDKKYKALFRKSNFRGILNSLKESAIKTASGSGKSILSSFFYHLYENASNNSLKEKIRSERKIQEKFNEISSILSKEKIDVYVFIDEIDRCEPKSVVRIFEALRAFFCGDDMLKKLTVEFNKSTTKSNCKIAFPEEILEGTPFKYIMTFDEDYIANCFSSVYDLPSNDSYNYISKYIQHKYHVPLKRWNRFVFNIFIKFGKVEAWLPGAKSENDKLPLLYNSVLIKFSDIHPRDVRLIVTYVLFWLDGFATDMKSYSLSRVDGAAQIWDENEKVCWEILHAYLLIQALVKVKYPSLAIFFVTKRILIDFLMKKTDVASTMMNHARLWFEGDNAILACKRLSDDILSGVSQIKEYKDVGSMMLIVIGAMLEKLCSL